MAIYTETEVQRFWTKVQRGEGCWEWTASRTKFGYGILGIRRIARSPRKAHRMSWEIAHGPIPGNFHVLHRCDNPPCVRPDHLYLGTNADNVRDRMERNPVIHNWTTDRTRLGSAHPRAKVTEEQVLEMRRRYTPQSQTDGSSALAREFGLAQASVWAIISRQSWTHI